MGDPPKRGLHGTVDRVGSPGTTLTFDHPVRTQRETRASETSIIVRRPTDRLARNRGWLARAMHWKTDCIIDATLDGPSIRVERGTVRMPLDWHDGGFEGGINTSGWKVGDAENMVFATRIVLHRAPDLVVCSPVRGRGEEHWRAVGRIRPTGT
jgi:hypothetical protein